MIGVVVLYALWSDDDAAAAVFDRDLMEQRPGSSSVTRPTMSRSRGSRFPTVGAYWQSRAAGDACFTAMGARLALAIL